MSEVAEELYLAQSAEAEHAVVEWGDLFDRDPALRGEMDCGATMENGSNREECAKVKIEGAYMTTP